MLPSPDDELTNSKVDRGCDISQLAIICWLMVTNYFLYVRQ